MSETITIGEQGNTSFPNKIIDDNRLSVGALGLLLIAAATPGKRIDLSQIAKDRGIKPVVFTMYILEIERAGYMGIIEMVDHEQ